MKSGIIIEAFYEDVEEFYEAFSKWIEKNDVTLDFLNGSFKTSEIAAMMWDDKIILDQESDEVLDHESNGVFDT